MENATLDYMVEQAAAAEWERINAPDPYEKQMKDAALEMRLAVEMIEKAESYLLDAVEDLKDSPMEDRVASLLHTLEDLHIDIGMLERNYERGRRE